VTMPIRKAVAVLGAVRYPGRERARFWGRQALFGVASLVAGLAAGAAAAEPWVVARSPHLVVYSDVDEKGVKRFVSEVEAYQDFLSATLGVGAKDGRAPLRVYLMKTDEDIRAVWPGEGSVSGFFERSSSIEPVLISRYRPARVDGKPDITANDNPIHEYTHYFQDSLFPANEPGWVKEGLAQYFQTIEFEPGKVILGQGSPKIYGRLADPWQPWDIVLSGTTKSVPRSQWGGWYGQAWLLTHYLLSDPQRAIAFNTYLRRMARGDDPVQALVESVGMDLPTLAQRLNAYQAQPLALAELERGRSKSSKISIERLSPSAEALLLLDARAQVYLPSTAKAGFLDAVRKAASRYQGDRFATIIQARAEARYGDPSVASTLLAPLVGPGSKDNEALALAALALEQQSRSMADGPEKDALLEKAEAFLDRAYQIAPDDFLTLKAYDTVRRRRPDYPTRSDLDHLADALRLQPASAEIRISLGAALVKSGYPQQAAAVLDPFVHDPLGRETNVRAAKILASGNASAPSQP
jgi:hypothetical protein